jgi:hypothetical protein
MDFANFQQKWGELIAKSWDDSKLHDRLLNDATAVLRENGVAVPPGVQVKVVQDTNTVVHLVMPPKPNDEEIAEEELAAVAGGKIQTACLYSTKRVASQVSNPAQDPAVVKPAVIQQPGVKR